MRDRGRRSGHDGDPLIGREAELAALAGSFAAGVRLLTIVGVRGVGKSRLAAGFASARAAKWPGGVWTCDLSAVRTLDEGLRAVARALGVEAAGPDPIDQLGRHLAARGDCLLVLDGAESVASHAGRLIGRWLELAPAARLLATSREVLGVNEESGLPLAPLSEEAAEALFLRRAFADRGRTTVPEAERAAARELARLADRLPLAIELLAAAVEPSSTESVLRQARACLHRLSQSGARQDSEATLNALQAIAAPRPAGSDRA
jgi:predicted ATPase